MKLLQQVNLRAITADADTFGEMLMILTDQAGMSRSRAILLAAQMRPSLYRRWMLDRNSGRLPQKQGRSSITSMFRFIGK